MAKTPARLRELRLVAFVLLALAGCGGPRLYPVSGVVTMADEPVPEAAVMFHPVAGGPLAQGVTDAEGKFTLHSANRPGLLAGEYKVTIARQKTTGFIAVTPEGLEASAILPQPKVLWLTPERYSRVETSGLSTKVPSDEYRFVLDAK